MGRSKLRRLRLLLRRNLELKLISGMDWSFPKVVSFRSLGSSKFTVLLFLLIEDPERFYFLRGIANP